MHRDDPLLAPSVVDDHDDMKRPVPLHREDELLRMLAATGARRGEVCGLRWVDLDLTPCVMRIRSAVAQLAEPA